MTLHPTLEADTHPIAELELCELRLMDQSLFPWVILVPKNENITEIIDLSDADQQLLIQEISQVSRALKQLTHAEKLNVAALGNVVPQLHIHIIARFANDAAWPAPVWGHHITPYCNESIAVFIDQLRELV